ncbi:DUF4336 domain-containing protein [Oscillatoria sp. FACHB-1407]|uniref:DUF4336 domain-containing protein n=1 Tax=Oscillatoria sp. FACHB-1407 TaxID=2692847 RepID=UPI001684FA47|nr:DUF4336 domain-containing protein [Oscillatoria sp. FACHB-1407]MBD2465710.1 DUF4336 domain-containing protein [Oscillatoria sp. FACHB-1407]
MLRAIAPDLWVAEQPLKYFGLEVGTRMTVIRLNQDRLVIIAPIQLQDDMIDQINQLGNVSDIIAPNLYHHLFLNQCKQRYPNATLWATSGLQDKCPDLWIDQVLSDHTIKSFNGLEAAQVAGFNTFDIKGYMPLNEWVFFHAKSRTLIITDLAFHFDRQSSPSAQLISKVLGGYQQLRPSLLEKIATRDKEQVRQSLQPILAWDFERVIMAHGSIIEQDGKRLFQRGYEWFLNER